jgi:RND family efflux transporter MFP subunit
MKEKIKETIKSVSKSAVDKTAQVKKWTLKKKLIRLGLLLLVLFLIYKIFAPKGVDPKTITIVPVEIKDLVSTVKSSGQVTSVTDLKLSFKGSDIVQNIYIKSGDKVSTGQILATIKNGNEAGTVTQARAALDSARASLERVLEGSTNDEVRVAQVALDNAKKDLESITKTQNTIVENAKRTLYSSNLEARPTVSGLNLSIQNPTISGTYTGNSDGVYKIELYSTGGGYYYTVSGLGSGSGEVSTTNPSPIGNGLYVNFPFGFQVTSNYAWNIEVPNKNSSQYIANISNYNNAISGKLLAIGNAESLINNAEANLALKKSAARPADINLREAEVLRAQGQLQSALGIYENTVIRAPANGTVTKMDLKVGELAKALENVITIEDIGSLYVESNINESNITDLQIGQDVMFTIDAFGPSKKFMGKIVEIEPGATIKDGIVNYKIKASLIDQDLGIKPGMNANLVITTGSKSGVLAIPGSAVFKKDSKDFIRVITDESKKKFIEKEIVLGGTGDGNMREVISGLALGDKIALIEEKK